MVADMARNHLGRPMKMLVYNSKVDLSREVTIIPNNNWGGKTLLGAATLVWQPSDLLGASIRFQVYSGASDRVWHILEVHPSSPASTAGLIPGKGTPAAEGRPRSWV